MAGVSFVRARSISSLAVVMARLYSGTSAPAMLTAVQLFVYGSLKSGYENAHLLARAIALGPVRTAPGYRLVRYRDGYPGLVLVPGSAGSVEGELYAVDEGLLAELDVFEDCPTLYERVAIHLSDGRTAQTYVVPERSGCDWPVI